MDPAGKQRDQNKMEDKKRKGTQTGRRRSPFEKEGAIHETTAKVQKGMRE